MSVTPNLLFFLLVVLVACGVWHIDTVAQARIKELADSETCGLECDLLSHENDILEGLSLMEANFRQYPQLQTGYQGYETPPQSLPYPPNTLKRTQRPPRSPKTYNLN